MAKKEDPNVVAKRKQERVAFVQANPQLAPELARQRFFVQTRMNELAATGSLGDRKALREKFQSGGVEREGFYTPADKKRIAGNNASGPSGTDTTTNTTTNTTTPTPTPTGSTTSTTVPKTSTTSTTTPTRSTTNTTTTPNQYEQPTTTTALGQVTSTTAPKSTTTTPAASTTKTNKGGFFDSGVGKFLKDTTTNNPNVGLQGIFNRNLPHVSQALQIPGDTIDSMGRTFVAPAFNLASEKLGSDKRMQEGTMTENAINTAFTLADIFSAGTAEGFHAPASALVKRAFVKGVGETAVESAIAKGGVIKTAGRSLIDDVLAPVTQSPFVNSLGRGGREYEAEQLLINAPKPLSAIPGPPGNPTQGAIMDFGPTRNPTPPGRSSAQVVEPVVPSRVKGRGAKPETPALTVVEGVKPGTTEASKLNHPSYKAPDAPNLSLVSEDRPTPPGNPSRNPTPPGNPSRSPKGPNAAPLTPAQKRAATIAAKKEAKLAEAKAADVALNDFDSEISRSDEFGDGWFTPDDAVPEGKQGNLKAPTSTVSTPEKFPTSSSKETTGAPIVNGKVQMPGTEPAHITEMKRLAALEKEGINPSEIVNREKFDAFGQPKNNDPLINPVGQEPAGQGPFDAPRPVGPQSLNDYKGSNRVRRDPNADEAAAMITPEQLERARLENTPMSSLIKNNIENIRTDSASRLSDRVRDYESRRYPTIDDMSGNPVPTPSQPLEGVFGPGGKVSKAFTDDPAVLAAREVARQEKKAASQLKAQTARKAQRVEIKSVQQEAVNVQKVVKTETQPTVGMSQPARVQIAPEIKQRVNPPGVDPNLSPLDVPVAPPIQFGVRTEPFPLTSKTEYETFVDVTRNPVTGQANEQSTTQLARSLGRNEPIPGQAATRGREFGAGEFDKAVSELATVRSNFEKTGVMTKQHRELERKLRETYGGERFDKIAAAASGEDVPVFRGQTPRLTQTLNIPDMSNGQSLSEFQQVFGRSVETPSAAPKLPELQTNAFAPYSPTKNPGRMRGKSLDEQVASWRNLSTSKEFQDLMINQPDLAAFIARQNKPFQDVLERQAAADAASLETRLSASVESKAWATVQEASGTASEAALRKIREGETKFVGGPENINNPLRGTEINPVDPSQQIPVYMQDWNNPGTWKTNFNRQNAGDMSRQEVLNRERAQMVGVQYDETQKVISQMTDLLRNRGGVVGDVALTDFSTAIIDELGAAGMDISQFRRGTSRFNRANRANNNLPYSNPEINYPTSGNKDNPLTPEQSAARSAAFDQPAGWSLDPFGSFNPPANNQVVLSDPESLSAIGKEFRVNFDSLLENAPTAADFQKGLEKSRRAAARAEREAAKKEAATVAIQEASRAESTAWWKQAQPYFKQQEEIRQAADLAKANRPKLTQRMRMDQAEAQRIANLEQRVSNNTTGPMTFTGAPAKVGEYDESIGAHVLNWSNPTTGTSFRTEIKYGTSGEVESYKSTANLKAQTNENTQAAAAAIMEEERLNAAEILKDWMGG